MPRILKIVVTGPFSAGKSLFVKTISDIPVVSTERKISLREKGMKPQTTVAMDYGRVQLGDDVLHLNGTPGQARFDFMWEILGREMHGLVMVVDATVKESFDDARTMLDDMLSPRPVPFVVAANKQDRDDALHPDKVRKALALDRHALVMPCVASRKTSVKMVLSQLAEMIQ
ncbi:MAG: GTP-binding protein [Chloroflexi bacterium]|nr:GTP-binding protein [Chloroflexota bacterium]